LSRSTNHFPSAIGGITTPEHGTSPIEGFRGAIKASMSSNNYVLTACDDGGCCGGFWSRAWTCRAAGLQTEFQTEEDYLLKTLLSPPQVPQGRSGSRSGRASEKTTGSELLMALASVLIWYTAPTSRRTAPRPQAAHRPTPCAHPRGPGCSLTPPLVCGDRWGRWGPAARPLGLWVCP